MSSFDQTNNKLTNDIQIWESASRRVQDTRLYRGFEGADRLEKISCH
jgi:hypothetical protein